MTNRPAKQKPKETWCIVIRDPRYAIKGINTHGKLVMMKELGVYMYMN